MLGGKVQSYRRKSDAQCMGLLSQCICTYWHSYKCPGHSYVSICLTAVQAAGYVTVTYWGVQATWNICSLTYCWYSGHQRSIPLSELPQRFSDFFHSTVTSIRRSLDSITVTPPSVPDQPFCGTVWGAFQSVSEDEVNKIPNQSTIKTCELDPLPASFLTHCLDDLLPRLTSIINDSLHSGLFPSAFKSAIVKPLLKKTTLNPEILKKLRTSVKPLLPVQNPWESCSLPALEPSVDQHSILFSSVSLPCWS